MKKLLIILSILILIFGITVIIVNHNNFNAEPPIKYISFELPDGMMAITIPPFGILISNEYRDEGDDPGTILAHEKIHWLQYQELGLFGFYYSYIPDLIRYGRKNHPMEEDARMRSK